MTDFVPNFSTQQLLPPWVSIGAQSWVFVIKVPQKKLQDFLDSHFNCGAPDYAPYFYEAFDSPYGILRVTKHDDFRSDHVSKSDHHADLNQETNPGSQRLKKIDVNWSYPVKRYARSPDNIAYVDNTDANGERHPDIVWVEPMCFDNNSYTMFSSREIWGTEADMARICVEENERSMHIDVAMQGLETFTPKSISHLIGVMHIEMDTSVETEVWEIFEKHTGLAQFVGVMFSSIVLKGDVSPISNSEVNTLKQFRDVFNMKVAVYRAIIASQTDPTNVSDMKFYDGKNVKLDFMWSQTMAESLTDFFGLEKPVNAKKLRGHPGGSHKIDGKIVDWDLARIEKDVVLAASFTSDMRYEITKTLHTYGN